MSKIKNQKGFTFVEMMIVISIIGILTAIAYPKIQQMKNRNSIKSGKVQSEESDWKKISLYSGGKLVRQWVIKDLTGVYRGSSGNVSFRSEFGTVDIYGEMVVEPYVKYESMAKLQPTPEVSYITTPIPTPAPTPTYGYSY